MSCDNTDFITTFAAQRSELMRAGVLAKTQMRSDHSIGLHALDFGVTARTWTDGACVARRCVRYGKPTQPQWWVRGGDVAWAPMTLMEPLRR